MKKFLAVIMSAAMVLSLCLLSACGANSAGQTDTQDDGTASDTTGTGNYPVDLGENQLYDFQNRLSSDDNYGFLLSAYDDVRDVDLNQVFYTGAGMQNPENSDDISDAYLGIIGETELFTDCTILTGKQIDDFLKAKTGDTLSSMNGCFTWTYVCDYDAYVCMHGDTNYLSLTVVAARQIDDKSFEVDYEFDGGFYDEEGNLMTGGTVTVKTDGPSMIFISNSLHA